MLRFSPRFCATFRPGFSTVPDADRIMSLTLRASNAIRSYSRTSRVLTFSVQSLRRSVSQGSQDSDGVLGSRTPVAALPLPRHSALHQLEPSPLALPQTRGMVALAVAGRDGRDHSEINAD
jgi:hypothetical protein